MADRPTIKLKPGAPARDPQRLRVRATTAPRKKNQASPPPPAEAPARRPPQQPPRPQPMPKRAAAPAGGPKVGPARGPQAGPAKGPQAGPARGPQSGPAKGPRAGTANARRPSGAARPDAAQPAAAPSASPPRPERRVLSPAAPATAKTVPAAPRPRPQNSRPGEGIRLSKALTEQGIASRREADDWIAAGWVRVDGKMAVLGQRVRPEQRIDIDPAARNEQARSVTILLHKPVGYVSGQAEDGPSTRATRAAWRRPAGWTSIPPACWC